MKKITLISLVTIVFIGNLVSQAPNLMSYQAVIWDASGNLVSEKMVSIKISILQGSVTGTSVYSETHRVQTNINGLVSLMIGGGTNASGKISDINWGGGSYFLKTETDPTGGVNFSITGTTQLVSVPYSLFSGVAGKALDVITTEPGLPGQVLTIDKNGKFLWSGSTYPKVSTSEIFSITQNAAKAKGIILSDGGSSIKERGVVWSTEPNPNISLATKVNEELGLGEFTLTISGLKPNTKYFVRAYATNGIGTEYGELKEFSTTSSISIPIVNTLPVTAITSNGAKSGGTISSDGGTPITAKGVIWSTNTSPTISLNTKTSDGAGINSFESLISGLNQGTKYFVRAYASNSIGTSYGENIEFSTVSTITLPEVVTLAISQITENGAISGGFIAKDGGATVTNRGIVWSKDRNPTISLTSKTSNGGGTGEFSSTLIDLTPNTTYFVRAYATNSAGTSYGNELEFSVPSNPNTLGKPCSSVTEIKDINGNKYTTIQIKNQCWLKENLRVEKFNNGDQIPNVVTDRNNITYGAWISHLNDSYYDSFIGKKYNWYAATDSKGICPTGWHLPSADEWQILRNEVGDYPGPKLKDRSTKSWEFHWNWGPEPFNNYQFSAAGAGVNDGGFRENTYFWSTTSSTDPKNVVTRSLSWAHPEFPVGYLSKTDYASIRCLKDENFNVMLNELLDLDKEKVSISATVLQSGKISSPVIERGIVYGSTPMPTISSSKVVTGIGIGKFITTLTGLKQGNLYYYRAYAKSADTLFYSIEHSFQTLKDTQMIVKDISGNTYNSIKIGNQIWMAENLRTNKYNNGDQIPTVVTDRHNIAYGALITHLNDSYYDSFLGKKYNWYAATDSRGICPTGWHLPSADEWQILRNEVGDYPGPKLKDRSTKSWEFHWNWGPEPFNNYQFSAAGAGVNDGGFRENTYFWSTTSSTDPKNVITRSLSWAHPEFPVGYLPKTDYASIRCLKN